MFKGWCNSSMSDTNSEVDAETLLLDNEYEDVEIFQNFSYDSALIGVSHDNRAIYDYQKMIEWLVQHTGWSEEDAIDWINYNTLGAIYGDSKPIIMYPLV